jgi:hypothetical protein
MERLKIAPPEARQLVLLINGPLARRLFVRQDAQMGIYVHAEEQAFVLTALKPAPISILYATPFLENANVLMAWRQIIAILLADYARSAIFLKKCVA